MILAQTPILIVNKSPKINDQYHYHIKCDRCSNEVYFAYKPSDIEYGRAKYGFDYCRKCKNSVNASSGFAKAGAKFLSSRTKETKRAHARNGGLASSKSLKPNSSKFSTERWTAMTPENQLKQVKRASKGLHDKLNSDPELKQKHFEKVYKNSKIGFISKGQKQLYEQLKKFEKGFELEITIQSLRVDICNIEKKIAIEFMGDYFHCNPRKYSPDYYNSTIKMFAKDKWEIDKKRTYFLRSLGYKVYHVWENDWSKDQNVVITKLIKFINENSF